MILRLLSTIFGGGRSSAPPTKEDFARLSVKDAKWASKRSDSIRASSNYTHAVLEYLSHAVLTFDASEGLSYLKSADVNSLLHQTLIAYDSLHKEIGAGKVSEATAGNAYQLLVLSHVSMLLDDLKSAARFCEIAGHDWVRNLSSPFWDEYTAAIDHFLTNRPYRLNYHRKLKDLERYWIFYPKLIETITNGRELGPMIADAEFLLNQRNQDKRVHDDNNEIDGSGWKPVKWDYRLASLLRVRSTRA